MDNDDSGPLGASLLQWIHSFEKTAEKASWHDLGDGRVLWNILQEVDDEFFADALPEPDLTPSDDWTRRWQNLKHVQKQVSLYYRDVCGGQDQAELLPDLQAIAADHSVPDLERLIMLIIRTAMASPQSNQRMAQRLMSLGREKAMIIAGELRAMEEVEEIDTVEEERSEVQSVGQDGTTEVKDEHTNGYAGETGMYRDPLLEREEELLQSQAVVDKLQAQYSAAQRQLHELRQDKEKLQEAFDSFRDDMEGKGRKPGSEDSIRKLQQQADNDRSYIEDLESQLQASRNTVEKYELQVARHKQDNIVTQQLRDDLQMLRAENEDLNQKMKANDNLKKKIQALQEQEKASGSMREELQQANERLQDMARLKSIQARLEKEIIEKQGLIRNQEYQIGELTTTRKHAEYEARNFAQQLAAEREKVEKNREELEELRQRQGEGFDSADRSSDSKGLNAQLDASEAKPAAKPTHIDNAEVKNLNEKIILLEQQLQTADIRLKQASERNAKFEEKEQEAASAKQKDGSHTEDLEERIVELRKQLDQMSKQPKNDVAPDIAMLQRENKLMASAWFDLSSRLQNNGVSIGRRRQEPKSWLGKQRALIGPYNGLVSVIDI